MCETEKKKVSDLNSMFSGFVLDPAKCSQLSLGEKRELVHEISQWSRDAPQILSSFTRKELREIICAETGEERKYKGYTKFQMIEHLLNLVNGDKETKKIEDFRLSPAKRQTGVKRKWQKNNISTDLTCVATEKNKDMFQLCRNAACRAALSSMDSFCKRCSCCICLQYDDNKDPSLWLTCGADFLDEKDSCGFSCHLNCALEDERAQIAKISCGTTKLDGSYSCVSCGKINGIMSTWRKQLMVAKETRRVDALCLRLSLCHKLLLGTEQYKDVHKLVDTALQLLNHEVGPLNFLCTKMARGIVNRLSCGAQVQKLCASAVEMFDASMPFSLDIVGKKDEPTTCFNIQFEESSPTSVVIVLEYTDHVSKSEIGCRIWHRKSMVEDYPKKPTFSVRRPQTRFIITSLDPSTKYCCKVSLFNTTGILSVREAEWETPDEKIAKIHTRVEKSSHSVKLPSLSPQCNTNKNLNTKQMICAIKTDSLLSHTSFSPFNTCQCKPTTDESHGKYENSVQAVKQLEHGGYIDVDFRVKFLTWFSLKATVKERKVVSVYVDTFADDLQSLAGQLVDTFMNEIGYKQNLDRPTAWILS